MDAARCKECKYFIKQQKSIGKTEGFVQEIMNGQKVVKVFCHEEKSKAEIAREMGITEGAVRKLLKNAEERIKRAEEEKLNAEYEEKEKKWQEEKNSNPITAKMPDEEYLLKKIFGEI